MAKVINLKERRKNLVGYRIEPKFPFSSTNVIDFGMKRHEKTIADAEFSLDGRKFLQDGYASKGDKLDEEKIRKIREDDEKNCLAKLLISSHPVTKHQNNAGRIFCKNVDKEDIFKEMTQLKDEGYKNIILESTAIYPTEEGVKIRPDCYAIYASPRKDK